MREISYYRVFIWNQEIGGWDQILETENEHDARLEYHKRNLVGERAMLQIEQYTE